MQITGINALFGGVAKMLLYSIDPFQYYTHTLIWLFCLCTGEGQYGKDYSAVKCELMEDVI